MTRGLCAYAITREHAPAPDVRLVTHNGLAVVVAEVDLAPFAELEANPAQWAGEPSEDDPVVLLARRYDAVVRTVFDRNPVLPLRFGTILRGEPAAVRLLTDNHDSVTAWLDRVAGHREWGVRATRRQPEEPAGVPTEGLSGTEYLALRRDRLAAVRRTRRDGGTAAAALHEALSRLATETVHRTRKSATTVLDAAYLVRFAGEPDFHAETMAHDELAVEVTGPWPPYSFVRLELNAGAITHV